MGVVTIVRVYGSDFHLSRLVAYITSVDFPLKLRISSTLKENRKTRKMSLETRKNNSLDCQKYQEPRTYII